MGMTGITDDDDDDDALGYADPPNLITSTIRHGADDTPRRNLVGVVLLIIM
jgi:hypothetical protein